MEERNDGMSRRRFLGTAVLGSMGVLGAGMLAGCSAEAGSTGGSAWDDEADVVVVGSGAGGHAAAIEAAGAGASVVMLERNGALGGDSALCDGILGGYGTRLAKAQGIEVTADQIYTEFMANPDWYGALDPAVARVNADRCGETIDWLEEIGVPFEPEVAPRFSYTDLPAIHQVDGKGAAMMETMMKTAQDAGVRTRTDTRVTDLVVEDGRVVGVKVADGSAIKANKGVVLATGGYSASEEMLVALNPENDNLMAGGGPGVTGDGLIMAMRAGAFTTRTDYQPLMYAMAGMDTKSPWLLDYQMRLHEVLLDAEGNRFCNEGAPFLSRYVCRDALRKQNEQGSQVIALVPSSPVLDALLAKYPLEWAKGQTPEEVATAIGLDPAAVKATVERYNGFVSAGVDTDFDRPASDMTMLTGPFYAAKVTLMTTVTVGGIKIDTEGHVLRMRDTIEEGDRLQPLPGLYATGEVCEWNCAAGWTVLSAATIGRIAGRNAAAETV